MGDLGMVDPSFEESPTAAKYFENANQGRVDTEAAMLAWLSDEHPNMHITVVPEQSANLWLYARQSGKAETLEVNTQRPKYKITGYSPPAKRLSDSTGALVIIPNFVMYRYVWKGYDFLLVVSEGIRGMYPARSQHIISSLDSKSQHAVEDLIREAGLWQNQLHNEIWVFENGYFRKDAELYQSIMKASWDNVILSPDMKKDLQDTVNQFFDSADTYHRLSVPWKRGLVFYGPPGNGKTISLKATMHDLYTSRNPAIPTIYVKTLPYAVSITTVFSLARRQAPCLMVLEDLDSLINPGIRSQFLNAVDGLAENDGILIIGTTNHLDQLDPGIVKRPSRFDRKYLFADPVFEERVLYCQFWQKRLKKTSNAIEFPDQLCPAIARKTDDFSFAYMQEAFVSSLLTIASNGGRVDVAKVAERLSLGDDDADQNRDDDDDDDDDKDLDRYLLWRVMKKQIENLRREMAKDESEAAENN